MVSRLTTATVSTGLATFALLYAPQPVLPQIAAEFALQPGTASLAVSAATGALALAVIPCAVLAERVGRRRVIVWSVLLAAVIGLLVPLAPTYPVLLALRVLQGLATAGIPAVAMAYLADEAEAAGGKAVRATAAGGKAVVEKAAGGKAVGSEGVGRRAGGVKAVVGKAARGKAVGAEGVGRRAGGVKAVRGKAVGATAVGAAMGAMIAGNSVGGMVGRLLAGVATDWVGWRGALALVGAFGLVCALITAAYLPAGRRVARRERGLRSALADRVLLAQYAVAVLGVAAFVSLFNVIAFRLALPPGLASLVFLAYAAGGACSAVAGRLADRHGRAAVALAALGVTALGALATIPDHLVAIGAGLVVFTGGFFAAHAVASGWVGARARAKGAASGVYLFAFYLGSSAGGTAGSTAYQHWAWTGLVAVVVGWLALAAVAVVVAHRTDAARKPSGTTTGSPGSTTTSPGTGGETGPPGTAEVADRTSAGTSTATATGKVSPP